MNQIIDWMQSNWYELGSLVAQFTFVFAGLWFAQKILKTMRASQQQVGALLRLSMSDGLEERAKLSEATHDSMPSVEPNAGPSVVAASIFSPVAERPTPLSEPALTRSPKSYAAFEKPARNEAPSLSDERNGRPQASAPIAPAPIMQEVTPTLEPTYEPTPYVAAPLTLPENEHNGSGIAAAGRGVVQWLQTPIVSKKKSASPLKKVVRWLQAPVRS